VAFPWMISSFEHRIDTHLQNHNETFRIRSVCTSCSPRRYFIVSLVAFRGVLSITFVTNRRQGKVQIGREGRNVARRGCVYPSFLSALDLGVIYMHSEGVWCSDSSMFPLHPVPAVESVISGSIELSLIPCPALCKLSKTVIHSS
jgi:hypothetical protein